MKSFVTVIFLIVTLAAPGCSNVGLKPGTAEYGSVSGTLTAVEEARYEKVFSATITTLKELELRPNVRDRDKFRALIVGQVVMGSLGQGHEVRVHVTWLSDATTEIRMRIVGRRDETRLQRILAGIREKLE